MAYKLSDIEEIFQNYSRAKYSDVLAGVNFGCDCGCGGDAWTPETWDEEIESVHSAIKAMKEYCSEFNIVYDGLEF